MRFGYEELRFLPLIHEMNRVVYQLTSGFPKDERFGLTSQIRRASVSVLLNVAEGNARRSNAEYARFTKIAIGSLVETDAGLKLAVTLGFLSEDSRKPIDVILQELYFKLVSLRDTMSQPKKETVMSSPVLPT